MYELVQIIWLDTLTSLSIFSQHIVPTSYADVTILHLHSVTVQTGRKIHIYETELNLFYTFQLISILFHKNSFISSIHMQIE